jgi:hydrogenase-1 operon protein HyaF
VNNLNSIPVTVVTAEHDDTPANVVLPILHQIAAMLEALISSGQTNSIDLRRAPLSPQDRDKLRDMLGVGEVKAQIDCLGPTSIDETAVSGVWWITHYSADSRTVGEFIEVTACPDILNTPRSQLLSGLSLLRTRLSDDSHVPDPDDIAQRLAAMGLHPNDSFLFDSSVNQPVNRGNGNAE